MTLARAAALAVLAACGRSERVDRDPPAPVGSALVVPDVTTIDWRNRSYDLASLGTVKARDGRATFVLVEDEEGEVHADQGSAATGAQGALVLSPAHFADLDGDGHDEALVPFEMRATLPGEAQHLFGIFVFTLRAGEVLGLGVVTSPSLVEVDGATLRSAERTWRWTGGAFAPDR